MEKGEWRALVIECRASGKTTIKWCEEKGIHYRRYVTWETKLNREEQQAPRNGPRLRSLRKTRTPKKSSYFAVNG